MPSAAGSGAPPATTTLPSWKAGTDCCHWEGISCDRVAGEVTSLNLSSKYIQITISGFHPALFFGLTSLRYLNLEYSHCSVAPT
jgi:hypothetical protein